MAFTQKRFFGASVSSWSLQLGWNQQQGNMSIILVEDPDRGDAFDPPQIGGSAYFEYQDDSGGSFQYGGLLQSYEQINDINGKPVYQCNIVDPREILSGAPVIIGAYNGSTKSVWNLINAYGFMEDEEFGRGFGGARTNESGMPWNLIRTAITVLTSAIPSIAPQYGGPLRFRGEVYRVDISELPLAPDFYRIGGNHAYLLDLIDQLCTEAGFDYYCKLVAHPQFGNIIKISTVSRKLQPALGKIAAFIGDGTNTVGGRRGFELRNEVTSAFLVGGNVTALYQVLGPSEGTETPPEECFIWPFWGLDDVGRPVVGDDPNETNGPEDFKSDEHKFTVPSTMINVLGVGNFYDMDVGEMRAALAGESAWISYVAATRPQVLQRIGLIPDFKILTTLKDRIKDGKAKATDFINPQLKNANGNVRQDTDRLENSKRLYQFVNQFAQFYYGRKFMVRLPDVKATREDDTERIFFNYEITDAAYLEDGAEPIGLPPYYEDLFKSQDGRFQAFCRYNNAAELDLSRLRPDEYVLANGSLFVKCDVDPNFYFLDLENLDETRAVITTPAIVHKKYDFTSDPLKPEEAGQLKNFTAVLKQTGDSSKFDEDGKLTDAAKLELSENLEKINTGGFPHFGLGETLLMPDFVAIPLKSNVLTYGPWFRIGPTGKTYFEQDEALVPWNYNGYNLLNRAGNEKIQEIVTNMQVGEMGSVEVPGTPSMDIGDALLAGGPNITGIDVNVGEGGVTTVYTLRTYTPRFGAFARANADRLARLVKLHQQVKRGMKQLFRLNDLKKVKERS